MPGRYPTRSDSARCQTSRITSHMFPDPRERRPNYKKNLCEFLTEFGNDLVVESGMWLIGKKQRTKSCATIPLRKPNMKVVNPKTDCHNISVPSLFVWSWNWLRWLSWWKLNSWNSSILRMSHLFVQFVASCWLVAYRIGAYITIVNQFPLKLGWNALLGRKKQRPCPAC
jgi:hypothetical protein